MAVTPSHAKELTPQIHHSISSEWSRLFLQCISPVSLLRPAQDVEKVVSRVAVDLNLERLSPGGHNFGRVLLVKHFVEGVGLATQLFADVGDDGVGSTGDSQSREYPNGAGNAY